MSLSSLNQFLTLSAIILICSVLELLDNLATI